MITKKNSGKIGVLLLAFLLLNIAIVSADTGICNSHEECEDQDLYTYDQCHEPGTPESYCTHLTVNCVTNNDCGITGFINAEYCSQDDVHKDFQNSTCLNAGTTESQCDVTVTSIFLIDCGDDICGDFREPYCSQDNVYHSRACFEQGCNQGTCISGNPFTDEVLLDECVFGCDNGQCLPECSTDLDCEADYLGNNYCLNGNLVRDNFDYSCVSQQCEVETTQEIIEECAGTCDDNECVNDCTIDSDCNNDYFCKFDDGACGGTGVCTFAPIPGTCLTIFDPMCGCDSITYGNDCAMELDRMSKLHDGECQEPECNNNNECGTDGLLGELFCLQGNVYDKYVDFTCNQPGELTSTCSNSTTDQLIEDCDYGCASGSCQPQCSTDNECGIDFFSDDYCSEDYILRDLHDFVCVDNGCIEDIIPQTQETCEFGCLNAECLPPECTIDSDCGEESSSLVCDQDNLMNRTTNPVCQENNCEVIFDSTFVETCEFGCLNGECLPPECIIDSDCGIVSSSLVCDEDNIMNRTINPVCSENSCGSEITNEFIEECDERCRNGECRDKKRKRQEPKFDLFDDSVKIPNNISGITDYTFIEPTIANDPVIIESKAPEKDYTFLWAFVIILIILIVLLLVFLIILG